VPTAPLKVDAELDAEGVVDRGMKPSWRMGMR